MIETCAVKGLLVKSTNDPSQVEYNHAPISLFSTPFSLKHYQQAKDLQPHLGVMINDLVSQPHYMYDILQYFKKHDELMQKMLLISEEFNRQEIKQDVHLCILRSDYMIDKDSD